MAGTYSNLLNSKPFLPAEDQPDLNDDSSSHATPPAPTFAQPEAQATPTRTDERNSERTIFRAENRTVSLPLRRPTKRHSFEFYEDQLLQIRKLKMQAEMAGDMISQSEIVRAALDAYLQDKEI
jgi:hypothetical protein